MQFHLSRHGARRDAPSGGCHKGSHGKAMTGVMMGVMTPPEGSHRSVSTGHSGVPGGTTAVFTMKEAAAVAGVSVSTLRRRRTDLERAGASIDSSGWKVPITALIATGLLPGEGHHEHPRTGPEAQPEVSGSPASSEVEALEERVRELEAEVQRWRLRAEVAEARAEERNRSLDALRVANEAERMALRMLTTQHPPPEAAPAPSPVPQPADDHPAHHEKPAPSSKDQPHGFFARWFSPRGS